MPETESNGSSFSLSALPRDLTSGVVVFLVALPLCLGIALASEAPLFSGLLAGIIGGIVVGSLSGSHTSVSGPAAGLTAIVSAQIAGLGSFDAFLLAVLVGGIIQIGLGLARAGALSAFFPSSVIKGLLAAIGVILILKQIPHLFGHDTDPEGEMSFEQPDDETTFSEIFTLFEGDVHIGAMAVGLLSIALLIVWGRVGFLKRSVVPGPLVVVLMGVALQVLLRRFGDAWTISGSHLVEIPVPESAADVVSFLRFPDFSRWADPAIYVGGITIAVVASLETLLNLEAVDRLDKFQRHSPPSRELIAQGVGNCVAGFIGALPVTSVIVRSSVNVNTGARTKLSAVFHGVLLCVFVVFFPTWLNMIPLSSLAAILLVTGFKLASPALVRQMWNGGRYQFIPFLTTVLAIVFTDLLIGVLIGLAVSLFFILRSNLRKPVRQIVETHLDGQVLHIELQDQVSFLNRASLDRVFNKAPRGSHVLVDARSSDYIDPDILSLIREFKEVGGPARGVTVSLRGLKDEYELHDEIHYADFTTRELRDNATAEQVLQLLRDGNARFVSGQRLARDMARQVDGTSGGQNPLAAVLSCIDSRVPVELVLDLGIGDVFSVRVAGNVIGTKSLASLEYGVAVAGVKLVLVLGHTRCGAVTASIDILGGDQQVASAVEGLHIGAIVNEVEQSVTADDRRRIGQMGAETKERFADEVARKNVLHTAEQIVSRSSAIRAAVESGRAMVVGALYDVRTGKIEFLDDHALRKETLRT